MNKLEYRNIQNERVEVREDKNDEEIKTIGGYAVRYNTYAYINDPWGGFIETFAVGAFDESIAERNQKCLWNHDMTQPLGSVKSGTLRFIEDTTGLNYDDDLPNNTWGNDAFETIKRGDVDGSSFGFQVIDSVWDMIEHEGKEMDRRTITKAKLYEVSPCTFPAYDSSEINCRSHEEIISKRDEEMRARKLKIQLELEDI